MKKNIFLLVISFYLVFASITAYAADETEILDFEKVIVDTNDDVGIHDISEYYGPGDIYSISGRNIVIDDLSRAMSSELILRDMDGEKLELYQIKQGMTAYYYLDAKNTIIEMIVK